MWSGPASITTTGPLHGQFARATSEPVAAVVSSVPPGPQSAPVPAAAESIRMPAQVLSDPSATSSVPQLKHSALGVFGWLLLTVVLLGGLGTLLYFAFNESGKRAAAKAEESLNPSSQNTPPTPPQQPATQAKVQPAQPQAQQTGTAPVQQPDPANATANLDKNDRAKKPGDKKIAAAPENKTAAKGSKPAAIESNDPKVLYKAGKAAEKARDFEQARAIWQKLETIKGYGVQAVVEQARVAYALNDNTGAAALALRALQEPSPYKQDATLLYGDALMRGNECLRAKVIFLGVRKGLASGPLKDNVTKKIAACNKQLGLAENDGMQR